MDFRLEEFETVVVPAKEVPELVRIYIHQSHLHMYMVYSSYEKSRVTVFPYSPPVFHSRVVHSRDLIGWSARAARASCLFFGVYYYQYFRESHDCDTTIDYVF